MRIPGIRRVAYVAALVVLAATNAAPSATAASLTSSALTSSTCRGALTALAREQRLGPASSAALDSAMAACSGGPLRLPRAQFAVVTDRDAADPVPVGLVFSWTDTHAMSAMNQEAPTYLVANGTGVSQPAKNPVSLVRNHRATVRIGSTTYRGQMNVSLGDAGQLLEFSFDQPLGTVSKAQARRAAVAPKQGAPVVVFSDAGPVTTTIGPSYSPRTFSLERRVFGIVTAPDGTYRGWSGQEGTGFVSAKSSRFWAHRAMFEPYPGIPDKAMG